MRQMVGGKAIAPNAPQQNPVEDIWLQGKRLIREFYFFCHSFSVVKAIFSCKDKINLETLAAKSLK
jgi:hypothetical protein